MSVISSTQFTQRLTNRLKRAGVPLWVAQSNGDAWGKYLFFRVGGRCVGGAGWTRAEAEQKVTDRIALKDLEENSPV